MIIKQVLLNTNFEWIMVNEHQKFGIQTLNGKWLEQPDTHQIWREKLGKPIPWRANGPFIRFES